MAAKIQSLIDKTDYFEQVRDQIGAILLVESTKQQALAVLASKDPKLWKLRIFTERSNPWSEFSERPDPNSDDPDDDTSPIVNVWFDRSQVIPRSSNVVEKQQYDGTFRIDCYGYGVSTSKQGGGHDPGDARASLETHRAVRLVRNILMSGHYVTLGMTGVVGQRMVDAIQIFQPQIDDRPAQHVVGATMSLGVEFNELSPQVQGQPLEIVALDVRRADTGQLFFATQFEFADS